MIVLAAALLIPNTLAATGRADATYSATLQASLTVSGFLDAERNPISKPEGLILSNINTFFDDSFVFIEGDATADADAAIDVIAGDPLNLVAGDRFEFHFAAFGTTIYPTGFSYATSSGIVQMVAENLSSAPVTIGLDFDYDYALSTSADDPELEFAYAFVEYDVGLDSDYSEESDGPFDLDYFVYDNANQAGSEAESFELTLLPGQSDVITAIATVGGDPFGEVPEPTTWLLGAFGAAMLWGAGRRRRSSDG